MHLSLRERERESEFEREIERGRWNLVCLYKPLLLPTAISH